MTTESPTRSRTGSPQQQDPSSDPASPSGSQQLRNRGGISGSPSIFVAGGFHEAANTSPTLSSFSSGSNALVVTGRDGSNPGVHTRKLVIRVDHSIATCFDPADKELHDLWAPKT